MPGFPIKEFQTSYSGSAGRLADHPFAQASVLPATAGAADRAYRLTAMDGLKNPASDVAGTLNLLRRPYRGGGFPQCVGLS